MNAYGTLAASYDRLTNDVDYGAILSYLLRLLAEKGKKPSTVLDLACGTGSLSILLAKEGYRVLGADLSEDMLSEADRKAQRMEGNRPYFIHQSMQNLRLPYPVDWVVCCLDSLNYLTDPGDCRKAIRRVYEALSPGGVFIFDVNTREKLQAMDGQVFLDEDDDVYCIWRGVFSDNICSYGMDLFRRIGPLWERSFEEHREYAYSQEELRSYLEEAGFRGIAVYGDRSPDPPAPGEQRIYFMALKE